MDSGVPDAGPTCASPLSVWPMDCGALTWATNDAGTRPRNHHLTDIALTDAGAFLYVVGGFNAGSGVLANVDRQQIHADGTLGEMISDTPMSVPVGGMSG